MSYNLQLIYGIELLSVINESESLQHSGFHNIKYVTVIIQRQRYNHVMSELDNKKALVSDGYNTLMKPSKSEDGASGKSTTTGHRRELEQSLASGKIVVELLDEEVDEFVPISSQFPDGQSFAVVSRSKREHGLKEQFAKWKKKLNKILQNTRHFEFSSCGDRSNVVSFRQCTPTAFHMI